MTVTARVEKPPIPTLWLDSWVGMKLVKAARGESLPPEEAQLLQELREVVVHLTLARRLLCVEGDQDIEYGQERLDEEVAGEFARLTLGIQLDHGLAIKDKQVFLGMDAFVGGSDEVVVPWMTFFRRDPIEELEEIDQQGFFVRVGPAGAPVAQSLRKSRREQAEEFERWRVENQAALRTFEDQLKIELQADARVLIKQISEWVEHAVKGQPPKLDDVLGMSGVGLHRSHWARIGGKPEGLKGMVEYFLSPQHAAIPENRVKSVLWADIVTGNERVRSSDPGDVDLLPHALGVAHFVVTDIPARRRVLRRGLDSELNVQVFSMRELLELIKILESLEPR